MEVQNDTQTHATPQLPRIEEVQPVSEQDEACLREIRDVLARHNCLTRFGVSLLHDHFDIDDDEVLVEVCDVEKRKLISSPMKKSAIPADANQIETNWRFDSGIVWRICIESCFRVRQHLPYHDVI